MQKHWKFKMPEKAKNEQLFASEQHLKKNEIQNYSGFLNRCSHFEIFPHPPLQ